MGAYVNTPRGRRYKADNGKLYASYEAALADRPPSSFIDKLRSGLGLSSPAENIATQQAVLNKLRSGGVIRGAQSSTPFANLILAGNPPIPNLGAARLNDQEVLMAKGGWNERVAERGPINVGGQTWYPAQSGSDLVYKRAPGRVGGEYGSIFPSKPESGDIVGADIGGDGRGEQYRQQLSQYTPKVFPMTAEGQQERYFGTPEFNYAFGAQTGKGPKTAEEMRTLAAQTKAPVGTPLSDYYRSQSAMGRVNQADIQKMYADQGRPDLQKWAAANPMLAQREFMKQQGGRPLAPDQETVMGDLGSRAQSVAGLTMEAFGLPANPVPPTQQPGPGGVDQGTRVSLARGANEIAPQQAQKTSGESMPDFLTTLSALNRTKNFLEAIGAGQ